MGMGDVIVTELWEHLANKYETFGRFRISNAGRAVPRWSETAETVPSGCKARAPDIEALGDDASKNGLGADRGWHRILPAELKLLSKHPTLRAAAPWNICAGFVGRHREELFIPTLEKVSGLGIALQHQGGLFWSGVQGSSD